MSADPAPRQPAKPHLQEADWFTLHLFNPLVAFLTRMGISVMGSRVLRVKGRRSGEWRSVPVNLLIVDGTTYLVAPRGHTQWVRNLRAAGTGELVLGRRHQSFGATELPEGERIPILRAYLRRWKWEVGMFFGGVDADSPESDLQRIAPDHPVFVIELR